MADKTREELEQEANEAAVKAAEEYRKAQDEDARANAPEGTRFETQEEYEERVRAARASGIFGDTDTTAGAGANLTDVPSADNEGATVAVAEADAEGADVSDGEARRQTSADASVTEEGDVIGTSETPEETANAEGTSEAQGEKRNATEVVAEVQKAESVEEVDRLVEGDERVTVKRAAEERKAQLGS